MLQAVFRAHSPFTPRRFSYDASGDLTSDGTYTYAWDARHRQQSAGGVTYTYDGDGKRVMKSSGTLCWNSPGGTPLAETNSSGSTLNEYIFLGAARIARRDSSGNVYYYFQDGLGTTKTLTNSSGVLCYDADFLPFGYEKAYTTSCAQNYKFTGLERDSETGLDQTLYRKYDSTLGRWLSPDPAGRKAVKPDDPQTWNMYAYVRGNPTTLIDPTGLLYCSAADEANTQNCVTDQEYRRDKKQYKDYKHYSSSLDDVKNVPVKVTEFRGEGMNRFLFGHIGISVGNSPAVPRNTRAGNANFTEC